jgi:hypothetical protein
MIARHAKKDGTPSEVPQSVHSALKVNSVLIKLWILCRAKKHPFNNTQWLDRLLARIVQLDRNAQVE